VGIIIYRYIHEEKMRVLTIRQRDLVRETFGRYLSNEVVDSLLDKPGGLSMSGEIREVTFVVSDLRGFTSMTSHLSPQRVIEIMNRYFERMVEVIAQYRGTVQEFQGDGLLIFFGAPLRSDDDPYRAVACAIAMQKAVKELNAEQRLLSLPELTMGIGINTGEVVVGNIGCEKRASYGAIGTAINLAYRIESLTIGGQVLVSPSTYDKVQALIEVRGSREVSFKGIHHSIRVYDAVGIRGEYEISLPEKEEDHLLSLDPPLPIMCFVVQGKTLGSTPIPGNLIRLGDHSAVVCLSSRLEELSNVKITASSIHLHESLEAYAKVSETMPSSQTSCVCDARLEITWAPKDFKQKILKDIAAGKETVGVRQ
jgi:adenylate cyclase